MKSSGPFYLALIQNPQSNVWFKRQNLGVNAIDKIMKSLVKDTKLQNSSKGLTNHSTRKTLVKKLRSNIVQLSMIIRVTGHAQEQSLDDYDKGNETEQRHISHIISNTANAMNPGSSFPPQKNLSAAPATSSTSTGASHNQRQK